MSLLTLFADPSLTLLYFLALLALSAAALSMALGQRMRNRAEPSAARYTQASLALAVAWVAATSGGVAVLVARQPAMLLLPPLERAVGALMLIVVGWAFLTADRRPAPSAPTSNIWSAALPQRDEPLPGSLVFSLLCGWLALGTLVGYLYTAVQWSAIYSPGADFAQTEFHRLWLTSTLAIGAALLFALVLRVAYTADVVLKSLFVVILLVGYSYALYALLTPGAAQAGSGEGALRLAMLAAMAIFCTIVYRLVIKRLSLAIEQRALQATATTLNTLSGGETPLERESVTLLKALGLMLEREKPEDLPRQIVFASVNTLKADVTALLVIDDIEYADVIAAYDNVQQRPIAAMALKLDEQPTLQHVIRERAQRSLSAERNLNELVDLYTRLDIQKVGPVYFQPLARGEEVLGVLVVALPYTQRDLREYEKRLLESLSPIASRLLAVSRAAQRERLVAHSRSLQAMIEGTEAPAPEPPTSNARVEMQASLELARTQINELSALVRDLQIELDFERSRLAELAAEGPEGLSVTQRLEKMSRERTQLETERERLTQALQEAQTQLATATGDDDEVYKAMIRVLQQDRDDLQAQKLQLERQLGELRASSGAPAPALLRDMLTQLSEERVRSLAERDALRGQLNEVEAQLAALGVEGGPAGLLTTIVQLTDERSYFKMLAERAGQERDALRGEFERIRGQIDSEAERDAKLSGLETEVRRLAEDREALTRQRDALRQEREAIQTERTDWEALRTRMVATMGALQSDLEAAVFERNRATAERNKLAVERATLLSERDKLLAGRMALQTERDQLLARLEGNRELLQKFGADGIDQLKTMIDDLTEQRTQQERALLGAQGELQSLRERMERADRQLSVSAANTFIVEAETLESMLSVAQELRTPLNAISAYVDLLLSEAVGILGELQRQFLMRVKANCARLGELIDNFVRVVTIDTGQLRLKLSHIDMTDIIDEAISATRTQFQEKGITLKLELPERVPTLVGDKSALQQVMIELLSNAYRAAPTDGEVLLVAAHEPITSVGGRAPTNGEPTSAIRVTVRDYGGGVAPDEQHRIFSRRYRADSPLVQGLGDTGVGLSIARALVEVHQGRLSFESENGQSSTFTLVLPIGALKKTETAEYAKA